MNELVWDTLSHGMTPLVMKKIIRAHPESIESLNRCKGMVMQRMFYRAWYQCLWLRHHGMEWRQIFERHLSAHGWIPRRIIDNHVSPYRMVVINRVCDAHTLHKEEWSVVNTYYLRMFWDSMFHGISSGVVQEKLDPICRRILGFVPGLKRMCMKCTYSIPLSEMRNDVMCTYCHDKIHSAYRARLSTYMCSPMLRMTLRHSDCPPKSSAASCSLPERKMDMQAAPSRCAITYRT